jgi:hypothetical protein
VFQNSVSLEQKIKESAKVILSSFDFHCSLRIRSYALSGRCCLDYKRCAVGYLTTHTYRVSSLLGRRLKLARRRQCRSACKLQLGGPPSCCAIGSSRLESEDVTSCIVLRNSEINFRYKSNNWIIFRTGSVRETITDASFWLMTASMQTLPGSSLLGTLRYKC